MAVYGHGGKFVHAPLDDRAARATGSVEAVHDIDGTGLHEVAGAATAREPVATSIQSPGLPVKDGVGGQVATW